MSTLVAPEPLAVGKGADNSVRLFTVTTLTLAVAAAVLAGWLPLGFSIVTDFLFAGPHNWIEFRYFLTRLPGRWGKLAPFFLFAFTGVFGLTAVYAALPWLVPGGDGHAILTFLAIWNTVFVAWVVTLILWRSRQNPRRDWSLAVPVGLGLISLNWLAPDVWALGLVYAHPLVALWILDRELLRSRPQWRTAYHTCLLFLPVLLGLLWWRLAFTPDLPGNDALTGRITWHAGGGLLTGISTHLLVATHTFLEMLHYSVWLIAIPLVGIRTVPWNLQSVPMARRSQFWRWALTAAIGVGACVVLLLWGCFLADYPTTRDVYFTVAMLHVLAEVPFLLRAL
jgi:hypothetical protein